ncbi:MAG TPA: alpha/beta hydrolase [Dehalococcoidia bacterium]|nr:alpha/beta hydrolase [Dehalococcoidia bacterium]
MTNGSSAVSIERDVVFGRGGDEDLRLDVYHPPAALNKRTAVVHLFGGGFTRGSKEADYLTSNARRLTEMGFVNVASNYRLAPGTRWPGQLHDAKAAVRWTRANAARLGIDPDKIAICGYSAGAQLAIAVAGSPDREEGEGGTPGVSSAVAAVLSYYTGYSPRAADGTPNALHAPDATDADHEATSPLAFIKPGFPPTIIFHGTQDVTVPQPIDAGLFAALQEAGADPELHLYAGVPHIFDRQPGFGESASELCGFFLERYVVNAPARETAAARA